MQNISFIGLGAMGTPMALNLLKKNIIYFYTILILKIIKNFIKAKQKYAIIIKTYQVKVMYLLVCFLMVKLYQI